MLSKQGMCICMLREQAKLVGRRRPTGWRVGGEVLVCWDPNHTTAPKGMRVGKVSNSADNCILVGMHPNIVRGLAGLVQRDVGRARPIRQLI